MVFRFGEIKTEDNQVKKKTYTIVVKNQRIEVEEAVYYAYHKAREAERYQKKLIQKYELSLEKFQEDGVHVEYRTIKFNMGLEDRLIKQERIQRLEKAVLSLTESEQMVVWELFLLGKSERMLSSETGIPQKTINNRKKKTLLKLRRILETK